MSAEQPEPVDLTDFPDHLAEFRQTLDLASRCADVEEKLRAWQSGDEGAGVVAADALDQLLGLLDDLERGAGDLRPMIDRVLRQLPAAPE